MGDYFSSRIGITAIIMMCVTASSLTRGDRTQTVDGGGCRDEGSDKQAAFPSGTRVRQF